jgi:hydrogenase maturation protease
VSPASTLVAGIGNIFLGDDGFGAEVARQLAGAGLPESVTVADYGISGMHLAYDMAGGYDTTILVDAVPRGGQPGTLYLLELDQPGRGGEGAGAAGPAAPATAACSSFFDAHGMQPDVMFRLLDVLGAAAGRVLLVGCEPASTSEGIGLSPPVAAAVPEAVRLVRELVSEPTRPGGQERRAGGRATARKEQSHVPWHTG